MLKINWQNFNSVSLINLHANARNVYAEPHIQKIFAKS